MKIVQLYQKDLCISDYILESVAEQYENNVIDIPVPTSDGTRKINKQENGLRSRTLTIKGIFRNKTDSDIEKLERMRQIKLFWTDLLPVLKRTG